jgi:hypothetical protein
VLSEEGGDSFFEQWLRECMVEPGRPKSPDQMLQHCDSARVDALLAQFNSADGDTHQIVVPKTMVQDIIKMNHDPVYVAHPGMKRSFELISLSFWWPGMRNMIQEYVRKCDECQSRKEGG